MWVAGKRGINIQVIDKNGKKIVVNRSPGELVPEACNFHRLKSLVKRGRLVEVEEKKPVAPTASVKKPEVAKGAKRPSEKSVKPGKKGAIKIKK